MVQTLVLNQLDEVLLVKWKEGHLKDQYTGCLGEVEEGSDEANAIAVVKQLVGLELRAERYVYVYTIFSAVYGNAILDT